MSRVADRYARALFELAKKNRLVTPVLLDLENFQKLLSHNPLLNRVIDSPVASKQELQAVIDELTKRLECQDLSKRFLELLMNARRIKNLGLIIQVYSQLLQALENRQQVLVTSAESVPTKIESLLHKLLENKLGKKVELRSQIDPALIGGFKIETGSYLLDFSIDEHLTQLKTQLQG
ncbi:MAG: ATP synthase F1 subunit delta [Alphaproteobacteria bacterium]|nr:ATP synthase F1 subunit delta [Alphaproteobacteria bacterium]